MLRIGIFIILIAFIILKLAGLNVYSWWWVVIPYSIYGILYTILYYATRKKVREYKEKLNNRPKSKFQTKMDEMIKEARSKQ